MPENGFQVANSNHTELSALCQGWLRGQGQGYIDIFGAAHKLTDGAIDGANIMSDGVINAGLGVAGGALNGARHNSDLSDILVYTNCF